MELNNKSKQEDLELKYCECCGGLWLRQLNNQETRCGACVGMWTDFAGHWAKRVKADEARQVDAALRQATAEVLRLPLEGARA